MLRRFQLCCVLVAWLLATGGQWHVVQSVAWVRMIANYARTMPLDEAVRLTFTADNMCGVCELVSAAQQQSGHNEVLPVGTSLDTKAPLTFPPRPDNFFVTVSAPKWSLSDQALPVSERSAPPLPPPRALAA